MVTLILYVAMFVAGIVALVTGKFNVTGTKVARGAPARIAGIILLLPFPLSLMIGILVGIVMASSGKLPDQSTLLTVGAIVEFGVIAVCFTAALLIAGMNAVPKDELRRPNPFAEDEDYAKEQPRRSFRQPDDRIQE
jgi:protein-S-isoprenylcysteine O-methyltransferase Ste14